MMDKSQNWTAFSTVKTEIDTNAQNSLANTQSSQLRTLPSTAKAQEGGSKRGKPKERKKATKGTKTATFLKDNDNLVEEVSIGNRKTSEDQSPAETESKKSAREDNRLKWSIQILTRKTLRGISREFIANKKIKPAQYTIQHYEIHDAKNRYNDILCIDATRVILKGRPPDDDYIHANWMMMPDGQKYICTQGPLQETLEDFWHMVFHEGSNVIVMLCCFVEGKHEKCRMYYPKKVGTTANCGAYKITLKEIYKDPFDSIKHLLLKVEFNGKFMIVHHFACPSWPDHTAPMNPSPTVGMFKMVRERSAGAPITVHCSAGIGRSATFVAIDYASQRIKINGDINMIDVLKDLRQMRFHAIQSPIQYIFLHMCLLELFIEDNVLARKGKYSSFYESYTTMLKKYNKKVAAQEAKTENKADPQAQ